MTSVNRLINDCALVLRRAVLSGLYNRLPLVLLRLDAGTSRIVNSLRSARRKPSNLCERCRERKEMRESISFIAIVWKVTA